MTPRSGWSGDKVTRAIAFVVHRDGGTCGLCGHPGANSLDHIKPTITHPELTWEPTNWQAVHLAQAGRPKGCQTLGCRCIGNHGKGQGDNDVARNISRSGSPSPPSRNW